jgi:dihydrofolate reductase
MRALIVTENITIDGVIDAGGNWFDVQDADARADMSEVEQRHRDGADAVLLGRATYEAFESYWPKQIDDTTGVTDYLNRTHKYVVSSALTDPAWANTTVVRRDEIAGLKERPGKDIVVTGSIRLVQWLVGSGLVDEYRLFVYPVVLGAGARLFEQPAPRMRLAETTPFASGVVLLTYRPSRR